jgi:hypothetical protein
MWSFVVACRGCVQSPQGNRRTERQSIDCWIGSLAMVRVAGAYGRLTRLPLIDWGAQDVAVLVERDERPWVDAPAVALGHVG